MSSMRVKIIFHNQVTATCNQRCDHPLAKTRMTLVGSPPGTACDRLGTASLSHNNGSLKLRMRLCAAAMLWPLATDLSCTTTWFSDEMAETKPKVGAVPGAPAQGDSPSACQ